MKKYFIITYGCQMNKSDSERIASVLEKTGYKLTSKENEADLIVVNMCSVRQSAVDRIYGLFPKFEKLKKKNKDLRTILTGCVLKSDRRKFKKRFDLILDIKNLPNWQKYLKQKSPSSSKDYYLGLTPKYSNKFSAFIPISDGCNNFCTYCVVPFTRGPLICRDHKEILKEAKNVIKKGFKEIWLLGQNVNDYYSPTNPKINFPELLEMVNDIPGYFWLRFISPNPKDFSEKLINIMSKSEKITPYLNLPIQSGDNKILKKMNRPYTVKKYKDLVKKIRQKIPDAFLSTDIIVGFPGETKKQFQNTEKLLKEIKFDMAYIAQYSPRPQTKAFEIKDNVSKKEKHKRWKILTDILKKTALQKNKKYVGKEVEVLVAKKERGFFFGKTRTYKTVRFQSPDTKTSKLIGNFVKVKITDALPWSLKAKLKNSMRERELPKLIVILGPTVTGKTNLAIKLAKKINGEIVSADSRQIYKKMPIGTAQPTKKERKIVPYHLVNIVEPTKDFNVAIYKKMALKTIKDIQKRGKLPFLVGGTGLYIQAIVDNITYPGVPPQKKLRNRLEKKTKKELFKIYKKLDPKGAKFIDKKNKRRLIRAIEVCKVTKKSFWKQKQKGKPLFNILQIGIKLPKEELKKRVSKRTEKMFKLGLEKEAKGLLGKYGLIPPLQTIGYQEWFVESDKKKVKENIKLHTIQFAKRQMTWFKRDKKIHWIKNYQEAQKLIKNFFKI